MRETVRLGRIAGIPVGISWTLLPMAALIAASLAAGELPAEAPHYGAGAYAFAGVATTLVFLAAILAHELTHAVVARRRGLPVSGITLWLMGGVTRLDIEAATAATEWRVAAAGPATSAVLGAGLWALGAVVGSPHVLWAAAVVWLGYINLALAVFNLLPGSPLDGGRLVHAWMWRRHHDRERASAEAATAGRLLGWSLVAVGAAGFAAGAAGGLWVALIGWFLAGAARAEHAQAAIRRAVTGRRVADVMRPAGAWVPAWTTVQAFLDDPPPGEAAPVRDWEGHLVGVISAERAGRVPPWLRDHRVAEVALPAEQLPTARPEEPAAGLLARMVDAGAGVVLVTTGGDEVEGVVTVEDLERAAALPTTGRHP